MARILLSAPVEDTMWSMLTVLTLSSALAADANGVGAGANLNHRELSVELAETNRTYRRGRRLHRWGNVATGAGLALVFVGTPVWLSAGCDWAGDCDSPALAGVGLGLSMTGVLTFASGPVLSNLGALQVAGALRQRGAAVDRTLSYVGLGYYAASFVVAPVANELADQITFHNRGGDVAETFGMPVLSALILASWLSPAVAIGMSVAQMSGPNRRGLLGLEGLTVLPTLQQDRPGVAIGARF